MSRSSTPETDVAVKTDPIVYRSSPVIPPRFGRSIRTSKTAVIAPSVNENSVTEARLETERAADTPELKTFIPHRLIAVSVSCPHLCAFCRDYVITPRCSAYQCSQCGVVLHAVCSHVISDDDRQACTSANDPLRSMDSSIPVDPDLSGSDRSPVSSISSAEQPLSQWNRFQVAHWLTVVGLSRFVMLFLRYKVDGNTLLQLVPYSPQLDQVVDPFFRQALRRAIMVLDGRLPGSGDNITTSVDVTPDASSASLRSPTSLSVSFMDLAGSHDFILFSFLREVACAVCKLPLLGLFLQGYQCRLCGIILHRTCKAVGRVNTCSQSPSQSLEEAMSNCSDDIGTLDYDHLPTALSPYTSAYFGIPLIDQSSDPSTLAPCFLVACTSAIERIATQSLADTSAEAIDLVSAYQQSASANTLRELHRHYAFTLPCETSSDFGAVVRLTQLLKAFLRDLPIPVIPEENYASFCALSSAASDNDSVQRFLSEIPMPHRATLVHLMKHLGFVWTHQQALRSRAPARNEHLSNIPRSQEQRCNPVTCLLIFRQILMRPPWDLITDLATALDLHLKALQLLFNATALDESPNNPTRVSISHHPVSLTLGRSSPRTLKRRPSAGHVPQAEYGLINLSAMNDLNAAHPASDGPTVETPPTASSIADNKEDLSTREWYWSDLTQAEVREIMDGLPDGYFLVRTASESSSGAYTLAIRHHGENRLIRIFHRGDFFGVVDPPPPVFRRVSELIDYYRTHTVFDGETLQLQPISRMHFRFRGSSVIPSSQSETDQLCVSMSPVEAGVFACYLPEEQLFAELNRTNQEMSDCDVRIKELAILCEDAMQLKCESSKLGQGYSKLKQWLDVQRIRLKEFSHSIDNERLKHQRQLVREKLTEVDLQVEEQKRQLVASSERYRALFQDQVDLASRYRKLRRQAQEIRRALKDRGTSADVVLRHSVKRRNDLSPKSQLANTRPICTTSSHTVNRTHSAELEAISDRNMWLLTDVSREHAETLLQNKPTGTFLIRSANGGQKLALSVSLSNSVQHCLIHHIDNRYGFVKQACTFDSLDALVLYYHMKSLKQHNPMLTTTLRYPIFAKSL